MQLETLKKISLSLAKIKDLKPLIHQITNYVTVNDCANITLAIGASPIMADEISEVEDIVKISNALVLNIGTGNTRTIESMIKAGKKANQLDIPVILDPVGAGASKFRNDSVEQLLSNINFSVIRGNISEISALYGFKINSKGVDASETDIQNNSLQDIKDLAKKCADKYKCIVAITGKIDIISDGNNIISIHNGHQIMSQLTGTGCMTTALTGCFCGVEEDYLLASTGAILSMCIAGELAYEKSKQLGIGHFHVSLFDEIYKLTPDELITLANIELE